MEKSNLVSIAALLTFSACAAPIPDAPTKSEQMQAEADRCNNKADELETVVAEMERIHHLVRPIFETRNESTHDGIRQIMIDAQQQILLTLEKSREARAFICTYADHERVVVSVSKLNEYYLYFDETIHSLAGI